MVGITRRGFGASAGSPPPSDLDTLVADIAAVLDTLGLGQVVLVGHSIAGEERTRFSELHAPRCTGPVYLDAAYDPYWSSLVDSLLSMTLRSLHPADYGFLAARVDFDRSRSTCQ